MYKDYKNEFLKKHEHCIKSFVKHRNEEPLLQFLKQCKTKLLEEDGVESVLTDLGIMTTACGICKYTDVRVLERFAQEGSDWAYWDSLRDDPKEVSSSVLYAEISKEVAQTLLDLNDLEIDFFYCYTAWG
jgi:hypothetical protein